MLSETPKFSCVALALLNDMKRGGHWRRRSGIKHKYSEFPPDLQTLIFELVEWIGPTTLLEKLEKFEFPEWLIPLDKFPPKISWDDYRDLGYAKRMINVELPPVVLCHQLWLDGKHRIWAWRKQNLSTALAIDLAEIGISIRRLKSCVSLLPKNRQHQDAEYA